MKLAAPLIATLVVLAACSSETTAPTDTGLTGGGVGGEVAKNPKGDPYPTSNIGVREGSVIQNFKFLGYSNPLAADKALVPIELANFYDPAADVYRMIHIQAAGSWCTACRGETKALVPVAAQLQQRKVLWLVSLAEGPTPGIPSKQSDLDLWIKDFDSPFIHVLDPSNKNLGVFYDASALPWNADIDAKTMKIIHASTGGEQTSDRILEDIDASLAKIK